MNKLKFLIPTLSVATVATGIFTTTSCSNQVYEFELNKIGTLESESGTNSILKTKNGIDFEANTEYTAIINAKNYPFNEDEDGYGGEFAICDKLPSFTKTATILEDASIKVDNTNLKRVEWGPELRPEKNQFTVHTNNVRSVTAISIGDGTIQKDSIIVIKFKVKEKVNSFYPIMIISVPRLGKNDTKKEA